MLNPSPLRPLILSILLVGVGLLFTTDAHAGAKGFSERPVWIGLGGSGGGTADDLGGAGYLHLSLELRLFPIVPELVVREGFASNPLRHTTSIAAGAKFLFPRLLMLRGYARVAFSHQHELGWERFKAFPLKAIFGVHDKINHRSGFETGGGVELSLGPKGHWGIWGQGTLIVLPGTPGPPLTLLAELGVSFAFGPRIGAG